METNRLRYFSVVARSRTLGSAAEILRVSPPALSKAIRALEDELGKKLFERSGRGLTLTREGSRLLPQVEALLTDVESLRSARGPEARKLKIGAFEVFSTYFLGPCLARHFPDVPMQLRELGPGALETALAAEHVDIGITYLPVPHVDIEFIEVGRIRMAAFGRKEKFTGEPLDRLPFAVPIFPLSGTPTKVAGLDGWPDERVPRWRKYEVQLMESALELCREGLAVAYLPEFVVRLHNEETSGTRRLDEIPLAEVEGGRHSVYVVKRKSDAESPLLRRLAKALREVLK